MTSSNNVLLPSRPIEEEISTTTSMTMMAFLLHYVLVLVLVLLLLSLLLLTIAWIWKLVVVFLHSNCVREGQDW